MSQSSVLRDALGTIHEPHSGIPRIVSLVPSLTELLCDLGLSAHVVGRTRFCTEPRRQVKKIPVMGGTKDFDVDLIRQQAPTHVIVNVDENPKDRVQSLADDSARIVVTHPLAPRDNFELYRLFGALFDRAQEAAHHTHALEEELKRVAGLSWPASRVLYLIWKQPWMTISRDTYIARMLSLVGWQTLPADAAARYPVIGTDEAWLAEVDLVLLASEPYPFRQRDLPSVAHIPALARAPVRLIDGAMASWYGSRAARGVVRYLRELRLQQGWSA